MSSNNGKRLVGPVVTAGQFADAILEAVQEDNPDKEVIVERHSAYVRIKVEDECIIRMATLEQTLGRPVRPGDIEMNMPSFAGFIRTEHDQIRFVANP